jgi:4-hydroxybenzoate polyprenyltransferase
LQARRASAKDLSMIRKILRFTKVEHTAFSLPLLFTGAWLGGGGQLPALRVLLLIVAAAVGARIVGMSLNRIFDRHMDARNPRTAKRELPSGALGLNAAVAVSAAGLVLYLTACALLNRWCLYLAPIPLIPLTVYSLLKRFTDWCHFGIGLCLALAPLGAYVATAGHPRFSGIVLLFSGFVFFWLSGADIIYAILDIESDRRNGVHSLPARLGNNGALWAAAAVHLLALGCLLLLLVAVEAGRPAFAAFWVTVALFMTMHLPAIPVPRRFFPLASLAGMAGAITPMLS